LIALPLIILLAVAIKSVHWTNGFEAGEMALKYRSIT
jgi:uncharacterized membrane protein YphA (DoxX/SURF4 family)